MLQKLGKVIFNGDNLSFCNHEYNFSLRQKMSLLGYTMGFSHNDSFSRLCKSYTWSKNSPSDQSKQAKVAVIGASAKSAGLMMGVAAQQNTSHILSHVISRDIYTAKDVCKKFCLDNNLATSINDVSDLKQLDTDLVVVYLPISLHKDFLTQFITDNSGLDCVMIPPIAANNDEMKYLIDLHRKNTNYNGLGNNVLSGYWALSHPINKKFKKDVDLNGGAKKIQISAFWPHHLFKHGCIQFDYKYGGGAWEDLGPHCLSYVRHLINDYINTNSLYPGGSGGEGGRGRAAGLGEADYDYSINYNIDESKTRYNLYKYDESDKVDEYLETVIYFDDIMVEIKVSLVNNMNITATVECNNGKILYNSNWFRPETHNNNKHSINNSQWMTSIEHFLNDFKYYKYDYNINYNDSCNNINYDYNSNCHDKDKDMHPHQYFSDDLSYLALTSMREECRTMEIIDHVYNICNLGPRNNKKN